MHRFVRAALLAACLLAAAAPLSHAGPPRMSYQGVLTDGGGNLVPDGNYNLTFRIYDQPAAGTPYWTEAHAAVPVVKGGFSVVLGSITSINVPFETFVPYYLGVQVGADPELVPRVELGGSPSAMSLGMLGDNFNVAGQASWFPSTSGLGEGGGFLHLSGLTSGNLYLDLEPDFSGEGLFAYFRGYGSSYVEWDGDSGAGEGEFTIGGTSPTRFAPGVPGDLSAQFSADAIASAEVLDEPGIASNHAATFAVIGSVGTASSSDLVAVTIDTPAPGYVVVSGDFQANFLDGASRTIFYQVTETSSAARDNAYYFFAGQTAASFGGWLPCAIHRIFYKPVAGSYTFYLQASNNTGTGAAYFNPTLSAVYVPTSYGTVTAIANATTAATFDRATPVAASPDATQPSGGGHAVDLRELELRVRREETRLAESRLQLHRAQMKQQQETSAKAAAARRVGALSPAPKEER